MNHAGNRTGEAAAELRERVRVDGTTWHLTCAAQWSINPATGVVTTN